MSEVADRVPKQSYGHESVIAEYVDSIEQQQRMELELRVNKARVQAKEPDVAKAVAGLGGKVEVVLHGDRSVQSCQLERREIMAKTCWIDRHRPATEAVRIDAAQKSPKERALCGFCAERFDTAGRILSRRLLV